ncbi:hypothetical protein KIH77_07035 [Bifidobacterium sp. 82T24]|uniref:SnoaL-like domain-containing protein n=1 Tax=Bifidobacterium primatium TaxID=2045438 RepID=A0A2M9HAG4_9BIFI|nr:MULTISPECIES: hypothetical protein [Bifidobacterium]MBW3088484.1 hypothetical protein [Bifidobacterium pluvialisilvae]PJM73800.1 hypothetical protein CS006_01080 [Bifidobacterium primatium]
MIIDDYIKALQNKDYEALSACFAERSRMFDYCPSLVGRENTFLFGDKAIDMYFHNQFVIGGFSVEDPHVVNSRTVNFYANYAGTIIHALAQIENVDDSGKIQELVIRPA